MIIATFNVNSIRTRLPVITRWLQEKSPDLLFLQETKTQDKDFPALTLAEAGYKSFYHGEKSYNGVAVLVKDTITGTSITYGFNDGTYPARVLTLRHKDLTVLNTYVPQGQALNTPAYAEKIEFFAHVRKVIEREMSGLFLWLGDLNVAPEAIDVTHPETKKNHVCFCDEIRKVFADTKAGLADVFRKFNPEGGVYTFYDYRVKGAVERNIGWRIDHMLASESLAGLALKCSADIEPRTWERPSDHVPVIAELNI